LSPYSPDINLLEVAAVQGSLFLGCQPSRPLHVHAR
jgi:hypothetical protein